MVINRDRRARYALPRDPRAWGRWLAPWLVLLATGFAAQAIGIPVAWLIGPLLAAVILALVGHPPGPHPPLMFVGLQAVIGTTLSASFTPKALEPLADHWFSVAISVILVLVFCILGGMLLARIAPIDVATASLGTVPGGASGMVAMSEELGADARLVAFMQYLRVIIVIFSVSFAARFIEHQPNAGGLVEAGNDPWPLPARYLLAIIVATGGAWLGIKLRLPAGGLVGAIVVGFIPGVIGIGPVAWPAWVLPLAYLLLAARIGARFDREIVLRIRTLLPYVLAFVVALSVLCVGLGFLLHATTDIDLLTAILATSPGGLDAATIAALATGANVAMVLSMQLVRMLLMVIAGPFVVRKLTARPGVAVISEIGD